MKSENYCKLEDFEKCFQEKIIYLEKIIKTLQGEVNAVREKNETLKHSLNHEKDQNIRETDKVDNSKNK